MEYKNVKPITYQGMNYRSKLEARIYIHFTQLGWCVEYEPEVPGLIGYQPDFAIHPDKERHERFGGCKPIYVEVKPLIDVADFYSDEYKNEREKIKRVWNPENDLIIVGSQLFDKSGRFAIAFCLENRMYNHVTSYQFYYSFNEHNPKDIGAMMFFAGYEYIKKDSDTRSVIEGGDLLDNEWYGKFKDPKIESNSQRAREILPTSWNTAWSKLQWKPQ